MLLLGQLHVLTIFEPPAREQEQQAQQAQPGAEAKAGESGKKEDDGNVVDAEYEEVKDKKG